MGFVHQSQEIKTRDAPGYSWLLFRWLDFEHSDLTFSKKKVNFDVAFVHFLKIWLLLIVTFKNALLCQSDNFYILKTSVWKNFIPET